MTAGIAGLQFTFRPTFSIAERYSSWQHFWRINTALYLNAPVGTFHYGDPGAKPGFTGNSPLEFNPNFAFAYDVFGNGKP